MRIPVACSVCGEAAPAKPWAVIRGFNLVRCPRCGVKRVSPRLDADALAAYYDAEYWRSRDSVTRGYFDYAGDEVNIRRTFRRRLAWLARHGVRPSGKSLDVGCAYGFLVAEAGQAGWDAYGLEWSEHAVAGARPEVRGRIEQGVLTGTRRPGGAYALITLWDYLEHSADPRADLETAARLLAPGGWLSLIVPDAGSWLARLMGPGWEEYQKPEEHLYFFTARQLLALLRALGFAPVARQWAGKYASLDFAFSRFRREDGLLFYPAWLARTLLRGLGLQKTVAYVNPMDKRHLLVRKNI
jgi:SAM-dependent methyltransferase